MGRSVERNTKISVRWWLVTLFVLLGFGFIGLGAIVAEDALAWQLSRASAAYWSGASVNIGSALVLAAIIVWFERLLLRKVATTTTAAVKNVAQQAAAEAVQETAARLQPRIDELDRLIAERASGVADMQQTAASTLIQEPSRDATLRLLHEATDIRAIPLTGPYGWVGTITVPAGDANDAPRIRVKYTPEKRILDGTLDENLVLESADGELAGVEWEPGQDAVEAFAALTREMVRSGEGAAVHALSASAFFKHLVEALKEAIRTRERRGETWIVGNSLYELIADGWVITDQGVEVNGRGVVIKPEQLQGWHGAAGEAPEGLDADLWDLAIRRGRTYFNVLA